jgi:hypothetical protein
MNYEQLKIEAEKLVQLLEENEQGCFTWHESLRKTINNIHKLWYGDIKDWWDKNAK